MNGKVGLSFRYLKKLPPYEDALREAVMDRKLFEAFADALVR
jgi:hypothetical protein